jgi:hypothetical protein
MEILQLCKLRLDLQLQTALGITHSSPDLCAKVLAAFWDDQHCLDTEMEKPGQLSLKSLIFIIKETMLQLHCAIFMQNLKLS